MLPLFFILQGNDRDMFCESSDGLKAEPMIHARIPRKRTIGETGIDLQQFHLFQSLPPEMRNRIYRIALKCRGAIQIVSQRDSSNIHRRLSFTAILRTSKTVYMEARSFYYSENIFAVGNGTVGSHRETNKAAFETFISRSPVECLQLIAKVHINLYAGDYTLTVDAHGMPEDSVFWYTEGDDAEYDLDRVCTLLCKHLRGITYVLVRQCILNGHRMDLPSFVPRSNLDGGYEQISCPLILLLLGNEDYGLEPLNINRLHWFSDKNRFNIHWMDDPRLPWDGPPESLSYYVIPNMVEGNLPDLLEGEGWYYAHQISEEEFEDLQPDKPGVAICRCNN